ncbi:MAG: hypothetical protein JSS66_15655 [Armatimonadetes bacterium]|nr:hypothetical protein [Armatimonadota bacterium]
MLVVWALAGALAYCYYKVPSVTAALEEVRPVRDRAGFLFPALVGFFAGGVLPELCRLVTRSIPKADRAWAANSAYRGLVWVFLAVMVDVFYRYQAQWFGTAIDLGTLAKKTTVDMFVFAPTVFVPYTVGMMLWRDARFRPRAFFSAWTPKGWAEKVLPTYVPNICFWIPTLFAVYAMPTDLQYPMSALATACWSLLFAFINAHKPVEDVIQPE